MYYEEIVDKIVFGIYITINDKSFAGYVDVFTYIKSYLDKMLENRFKKYSFVTFTTNFEIALFKAFDDVFNTYKNITHVGCYFHYVNKIRKKLQGLGITANKYIYEYKFIMWHIDFIIRRRIIAAFTNNLY